LTVEEKNINPLSMDLYLDTPIQYLKGVGPHYSKSFEKRGLYSIQELLEWFPRTYEDRRAARTISSLQVNETVSLKAEIVYVKPIFLGKRKIYDVLVKDASGQIHCKYFRVPFKGYFDRLEPHKMVRVVGKVIEYRGSKQFHHPDIKDATDEEIDDQLIPIYTETEGLTPQRLHKIMGMALDGVYSRIPETLPEYLLKKLNLPSKKESLKYIHQPPKEAGPEFFEQKSPFHKRIIFEEFFWLQLFLAIQEKGKILEDAPQMKKDDQFLEKSKSFLPFELTNAQIKSFEEIRTDICEPHPMRRLIQGDVGSGKTIVSFLAAYYVIKNGYQAALMVPTEILADQHYKNAQNILGKLGVRIEILKGSQTAKEKAAVTDKLIKGEIDLLIGTHALIQEGVDFKNLALAIVDEQHRFGVIQRQKLKQKGYSPHFLLMTATPIPRTLALTVYGDLQCSIINELPKGRAPITTRVVRQNKHIQVFEFLKDQIKRGRQAYVVYPLVEESEKIDLKNAMTEFESIKKKFPEFKVGLLHGRMKSQEKDEVMNEFRQNKIQILVATTVIEVGVDVPNANIMVVEHSERFGLSQLHQLRGRVGRGTHKSYCVLMLGYAVSEEAYERTAIMAETSDGFKISEKDLEFRGPGEFMGSKQSGLPGFKMGNLVRDLDMLMKARELAFEIIGNDPSLSKPANAILKEQLVRIHGPQALITVG
jgi:ATP-dependent DNA helicase RecG